MPHLETVVLTEAYRKTCEDRVAVFDSDGRTVIVVADGAGGSGDGAVAADVVVHEVGKEFSTIHTANYWVEFLRRVDRQITSGESTAVVVDIRPYGIAGASVGDSQAWIIDHEKIDDLTRDQERKPLLGSGEANPAPFSSSPLEGKLLVATDGFFDYAKRDAITRAVTQCDFYEIPQRCVDIVRLPSGDLWDDVGVVAARNPPRRQTRKQYTI